MAVAVFRDSLGAHLVARVGDETDRIRWDAYLVDDRGVNGPQALGSWLRFRPSDYVACAGPFPPDVQVLMDRLSAGE
jgi:hypothetical protein